MTTEEIIKKFDQCLKSALESDEYQNYTGDQLDAFIDGVYEALSTFFEPESRQDLAAYTLKLKAQGGFQGLVE